MAFTYINGGTGNDLLDGSKTVGPQQFQGRAGNDTVTGGSDNDKLYGNEGDDVLSGGAGADSLSGGTGADTYIVSHVDFGAGTDLIMDFDGAGDGSAAGGDVIKLVGFSNSAKMTFVRQSGDDHIYQITDGAVSGQLIVRYAGTAALVAGDYVFQANRAPVLSGTQATLNAGTEDTAYTLTAASLLQGYADPDGDPVSLGGLSINRGSIVNNGNGTYTVTPLANDNGTLTLSYAVTDSSGGALAVTRAITIAAVNDAPVAGNDTATVLAAGPRTLTLTAAALLGNDSDIDGGTLRITAVGTTANGTLSLNTNGTAANYGDDFVTYTPNTGYSGTDTFTYSLGDGAATVQGTVTVTVQPAATTTMTYLNGGTGNDVLDAATATGPYQIQGRTGDDTITGGSGNDKLYGNEGNDVLTGGAGIDSFSGGTGADTFIIARGDVAAGVTEVIMDFEGAGDGAATGDTLHLKGFGAGATLNFIRQSGNDHLYEVRDGASVTQLKIIYAGTSALAAGDFAFVAATGPANHAPVAAPHAVATTTNGIVSGRLTASDSDGDTVLFSVQQGPAHGTLKLAANGAYIYAPTVGYTGSDTFIARLDDGHGGTTQATISVSIAASAADPAPYRDTSPAGNLVFIQRDGTSGSFYVGADQARILKGGTVVAQSANGVFLGVPQGDGYVLETVTGGVTTTRPLAIGEVVAAAGQSNMVGWFTDTSNSVVPQSGVYLWDPTSGFKDGEWIPAAGASALAFAETLRQAEPGLPVAFINGGSGGTSLVQINAKPYWLATGDATLYDNLINQVTAATHGQSAILLWNQGEADAAVRVDPTTYANGLKTLFGRFDAAIAPEHIVISGLASTGGNSDALRTAQASVATADKHIIYVPTNPALETRDGTHLTVQGRILQGVDDALALLSARGVVLPNIAWITGGPGSEALAGGTLIDIIQSSAGSDSLSGADGNDLMRGEAGADRVNGDGGNDALSGGNDNDTVDGGAGNDDVLGDAGDDQLWGGTGADRLNGGAGIDTMYGQAGDDIYYVDNAGDVVNEAQSGVDAGGVDAVYATLTHALAAYVENLVLSGDLSINGTGNGLANVVSGNSYNNLLAGVGGNDSLYGSTGIDTLEGGDGNDVLDGGAGLDSMDGGAGNDTYYVDAAGDVIVENAGGGTDTVLSSVTYTLSNNVEAVTLTGKNTLGATGSATDNSLTGNGSNNALDGAAGNDTLTGLAGNDSLRGGLGNDLLQGGDGVDTLIGGLGADTLTGNASVAAKDVFLFESLADIGLGSANRDTVSDFDSADVFDLAFIDANSGVAGDQAFAFIGTGAFTAAGQIRYTVVGSDVLIQLNVDADLGADGEIMLLHPLASPGVSDFVL